ncbi:MAG: hypothetical protein J2P32_03335 [Actinobacteria bacterium]|nr:hypothetical protein [Actinomycetota bacterium]
MTGFSWPADRRITVADLRAATDHGDRWAMLTSYVTDVAAGAYPDPEHSYA